MTKEEQDNKEIEAFQKNLSIGGEPFLRWVAGVASLCGWDYMYNYKVVGNDKMLKRWQSGITPEELFEGAKKFKEKNV